MLVSFYGKLGDLIGREVDLAVPPGATLADVRQTVADRYPAAASEILSDRVRACLNDELAQWDQALGDGDRVAFLPPVSGG